MLGLSALVILCMQAATPVVDADWQVMNQGGIIGTNGSVDASVYRDGKLYAGGRFTLAGGVFVKNLAVWDGHEWSAFGKGSNRGIVSMTLDKQGNIYVAGSFDTIDGISARRIAKWDGKAWSQLGTPPPIWPSQMVGNQEGHLYVLGGANPWAIAHWNGTTWDSMSVDTNLIISDMAIDARHHLYICGEHKNQGLNVFVEEWDGQSWKTLADTTDGAVYSIAVSSKGIVTLGGWFRYGRDTRLYRDDHLIKIIDGKWWPQLYYAQEPVFQENYKQLYYDEHDNLFVTGDGNYGSAMVARIDTMDDYKHLNFGPPTVTGPITSDGKGGAYFGDLFWNGSAVVKLKTALYSEGRVTALETDHRGNLYISGGFDSIGGVAVHGLTRWNGGVFSTLGRGLDTGGAGQYITAMTTDPMGRLIVGGGFAPNRSSRPARRIARWDGQAWSPLGTGFPEDNLVYALIADSQGNVVAGGRLDSAGGVPVKNLARWNGVKWSDIGGGVSPYPDDNWGFIYTMALDANGNLVVGGWFGFAGGVSADGLAKWDGVAWKAYHHRDTGVPPYQSKWQVKNILIDKANDVFISGDRPIGLYKRSTDGWLPLGADTIQTMIMDGEGNFYVAGGQNKKGFVKKYDGTTWSSLGSGTDGPVYALAISDSTLYVGGEFTFAGDKLSPNLARVNIHTFTKAATARPRREAMIPPRSYFIGDVLNLEPGPLGLRRIEIFSLSGRLVFAQDVLKDQARHQFKLSPSGPNVLICRWVGKDGSVNRFLLRK
jgi:hypothetical protein